MVVAGFVFTALGTGAAQLERDHGLSPYIRGGAGAGGLICHRAGVQTVGLPMQVSDAAPYLATLVLMVWLGARRPQNHPERKRFASGARGG